MAIRSISSALGRVPENALKADVGVVPDQNAIQEAFLAFCGRHNYQVSPPASIIAENDPTLLCVNSSMAPFKAQMLRSESIPPQAISQPCFRENVSEEYLHYFHMLGIVADDQWLKPLYESFLAFLTQLGLTDCRVVLHADDSDLLQLSQLILDDQHIHILEGENGKYKTRWKFGQAELVGRGLTIAAGDRDIMQPACTPLANIILITNQNTRKTYVEMGGGIECIQSYFYGGKIFDIPCYKSAVDALKHFIANPSALVKNFIALAALQEAGVQPGRKGREFLCRKLQGEIRDALQHLHLKEQHRAYTIILDTCSLLPNVSFSATWENLIQQKNLSSTKGNIMLALTAASTGHLTLAELKAEYTSYRPVDLNDPAVSVIYGQGPYKADAVARQFLDFFKQHGHIQIAGGLIVPQDDPTLLFINSGMAPLKPYFLGAKKPPLPTLCNVQVCVRTNDIDDIGDRHHLSLFHMLGSWSIGDYYKEEAVRLAHDLLVNVYRFDPNKLYATVFGGDQVLGLEPDHESADAWRKVGLPEAHIVYLAGDDNFWGPAGDTGPCGPCTEVFYDTGDAFAPPYQPGKPETFDMKKRYIEIWNAGVFMQYDKSKEGVLTLLELKSVDTGSGLERMTMTLNQMNTVYDTDLLSPIVSAVKNVFPSSTSEQTIRMLTDHFRTATYIIASGVMPGATGREYIVRKLVRKCAVVAYCSGIKKPDFRSIISTVIQRMALNEPWLARQECMVQEVICNEVAHLMTLLEKKAKILNKTLSEMKGDILDPQEAFKFVSTHGIPFDVLKQYIENQSKQIDMDQYSALVKKHKDTSKVKKT